MVSFICRSILTTKKAVEKGSNIDNNDDNVIIDSL